MKDLAVFKRVRLPMLRRLQSYRIQAGGSWRCVRGVWFPRCETRSTDDISAKERHPRKPWSQPYDRPEELVTQSSDGTNPCTA